MLKWEIGSITGIAIMLQDKVLVNVIDRLNTLKKHDCVNIHKTQIDFVLNAGILMSNW